MENLRYIIVFDLYNANLLLLRRLRYSLSNNTNVYQNQPRGKWLFVEKKSMMENRRQLILDDLKYKTFLNICVFDMVLNFSKPILWIFPTFVYILKRKLSFCEEKS